MRKKWLLESGSRTYVITRARDLFPEEQVTLPPGVFSAHVDAWLADSRSRQTILDIGDAITGRSAAAPTRSSGNALWRSLKPQLEQSFRRGELVILSTRNGDVFRTIEEKEQAAPPPPPRRPPPPPQKTWIGIVLVDDKDKPMPHVRYMIELPDGSFMDGKLDDEGRAKITGVDPGQCLVWFPDIDGKDWEKI